MTEDIEPYENTLSVEELRREVRRLLDTQSELIKALRELPDVPHWRVQRLLGMAATWPDDGNIGKRLQRELGLEAVAPKTEYEMGAGLWWRIREGLAEIARLHGALYRILDIAEGDGTARAAHRISDIARQAVGVPLQN